MDVILFETLPNLGRMGDRVKVKPGYARNYLIPQGKAVPATPENIAALEARRAELEQQEAAILAEAQAKAQAIEGLSVTITRKAGEEGKLFGSVGTHDIVDAVREAGVEIARHEVLLPAGTLREIGDYEVHVRPHPDVETVLKVVVAPES